MTRRVSFVDFGMHDCGRSALRPASSLRGPELGDATGPPQPARRAVQSRNFRPITGLLYRTSLPVWSEKRHSGRALALLARGGASEEWWAVRPIAEYHEIDRERFECEI